MGKAGGLRSLGLGVGWADAALGRSVQGAQGRPECPWPGGAASKVRLVYGWPGVRMGGKSTIGDHLTGASPHGLCFSPPGVYGIRTEADTMAEGPMSPPRASVGGLHAPQLCPCGWDP